MGHCTIDIVREGGGGWVDVHVYSNTGSHTRTGIYSCTCTCIYIQLYIHCLEMKWGYTQGGCVHIVSFPDDFLSSVGKRTSGNPPFPFQCMVFAIIHVNITCITYCTLTAH